jgi:hypothetical protein
MNTSEGGESTRLSGPRKPELVWNDPESEEAFEPLVEVIRMELTAQFAMGIGTRAPEDHKLLAELIADEVLDDFRVRRRSPAEPRTSFKQRDD